MWFQVFIGVLEHYAMDKVEIHSKLKSMEREQSKEGANTLEESKGAKIPETLGVVKRTGSSRMRR